MIKVDVIEQTIEGKIIAVGFVLPEFASIPITDVGRNWMLEQLIAMSIIIGNETTFLSLLSFCIDSIALIPSGVAAPFMPSKFADIFIETYFLLSSERLFLPNILFIIGESSLDNFLDNPLCSKMENTPIQIAYIAHSSNDNLTALFDADKSPDKTCVGSKTHRAITLEINSTIQILFIVNDMWKIFKYEANMIDTHAHILSFDDKEDVIGSMKEDGLDVIVNIGTTLEDSKLGVELANENENVYTTVGIYPELVYNITDDDLNKLEELAKSKKVVAIGEIGLDYHAENYDKDKQIEIFVKQLEIADRLGLPFCVHCRNAVDDVYQTLLNNKHLINHSGLMHCYSEGKDWFRKFLDLGLYISFSGNITFKKNDRSFLKDIDLNKLLVETDSPYLSPEPFRGRVNRPKNVRYVIEKIASEIGLSFDELEKITTENAKRFYFKIR